MSTINEINDSNEILLGLTEGYITVPKNSNKTYV